MTPMVTFNQFIKEFPNIKSKSKELAKKILPLYPSPELAEIVAALLTDGHIDWHTSDGHPRPRKAEKILKEKIEIPDWTRFLIQSF